jgi:hypothetical protein
MTRSGSGVAAAVNERELIRDVIVCDWESNQPVEAQAVGAPSSDQPGEP